MSTKFLVYIALSVAVLSAAVSAAVVSFNRSTAARARAAAAASEQATATAERKKAESLAAAESAKQKVAEANAKAEKDRLAAEKVEKEKAEAAERASADDRKAAEAEAAKAKAESEAAVAKREEAKAKAKAAEEDRKKAEALAKAEAAKAEAAAAALAAEKQRSEKTIAEAKLKELRKLDLETAEQTLREWQRDLEEREAALKPEKTIADLAWAGGEGDSVLNESGDVVKKVKEPYDPEKDPSLSKPVRHLIRTERRVAEEQAKFASENRVAVVKALEKLYVAALKERRSIDAEYYYQTIKSLYSDWEFKLETPEKFEAAK